MEHTKRVGCHTPPSYDDLVAAGGTSLLLLALPLAALGGAACCITSCRLRGIRPDASFE